jgi:hypothetical protein
MKNKTQLLAQTVATSSCGVPKLRDATRDTANGGWNSEVENKRVLQNKKIPFSFNTKWDFSFANSNQTNQNSIISSRYEILFPSK